MKTRLVLPVLAFVLIVSPVSAETWYVDWKNRQGGDGSSWAEAFIDLREALDRIDDGDEIWLAKGHYRLADGTFEETGNPYPNRFIVEKEVFIRGGFDGFESDPSQRDPLDPTETILDGDRLGNDVTPGSNPADNAGRVFDIDINLHQVVALEGLTVQASRFHAIDWVGVVGIPQELIIRNCRIVHHAQNGIHTSRVTISVLDTVISGNGGNGLQIADGEATIENTEVTVNDAHGIRFTTFDDHALSIEDSVVTYNAGNGLTFQGTDQLTLESSEFSWNSGDGAFLNFTGPPNSQLSSEFIDCDFVGNGERGMVTLGFPDLSLSECEFSGNKLGLRMDAATARVNDCEFSRNAIDGDGGAIFMVNGAAMIGNRVLIAENGHSFASGIRLRKLPWRPGCELVLANARFLGNHKTALHIDGANNSSEVHHVTLLNPVFVGNVNPNNAGGAIRNGGSLTIRQGTFVGNEAVGSGDVIAPNTGGSLSSYTNLVQCLFYDNAASGGNPIDISHLATNNLNGPRPLFVRFPSSGDGDWTTPDDNDYGDLNLGRRSPGIDAGLLQHLPGDWSDLDGDGFTREYLPLDAQLRSRIIGQHPDIGAYESRERNFR